MDSGSSTQSNHYGTNQLAGEDFVHPLRGVVLHVGENVAVVVLPEPETGALLELLAEWPERVSSALARVEVSRAVKRAGGDPSAMQRTGEVLDRLDLIRIDAEVLGAAAKMPPSELRTLGAIHLATALLLRDQLGAPAAYDARLAKTAGTNGPTTLSPA